MQFLCVPCYEAGIECDATIIAVVTSPLGVDDAMSLCDDHVNELVNSEEWNSVTRHYGESTLN